MKLKKKVLFCKQNDVPEKRVSMLFTKIKTNTLVTKPLYFRDTLCGTTIKMKISVIPMFCYDNLYMISEIHDHLRSFSLHRS